MAMPSLLDQMTHHVVCLISVLTVSLTPSLMIIFFVVSPQSHFPSLVVFYLADMMIGLAMFGIRSRASVLEFWLGMKIVSVVSESALMVWPSAQAVGIVHWGSVSVSLSIKIDLTFTTARCGRKYEISRWHLAYFIFLPVRVFRNNLCHFMLNLLLTCKSWTSGLDIRLSLSFGLTIHSGLPFQKLSLFTSYTSSFYCSLFTLILAVVYTSYPNPGVIVKLLPCNSQT